MRNHAEDLDIKFRIEGKTPELWYADRGISKPVSYKIENGVTTIKLHLEAQESLFVVFQKTAIQNELIIGEKKQNEILKLSDNWKVSFWEISGNSKHLNLEKLTSWANNEDETIKYFSGIAIYTRDFEFKKTLANTSLILDLGIVKDIATIFVNGKELETLWKAPYEVDISKAVKMGKNTLELRVTNQWDNRIIGDRILPKEKKILSSVPAFGVGQKLKESGLPGPVVLKSRN